MNDTDTTVSEECDVIVGEIRKKCLTRGFSNLKCFGTAFRQFDKDYSHKISFSEFQKGFQKFGVSMTEEQELELFKRFDGDNSGTIDFHEFCHSLIPPLEGKRLEVVEDVFHQLDTSGDGLLQTSDIMELLSSRARAHPKCRRGEWTVTECIDHLLAAFEQPESRDGVVTLQEFVSYYTTVSWCIQNDASFEGQLRSGWGI